MKNKKAPENIILNLSPEGRKLAMACIHVIYKKEKMMRGETEAEGKRPDTTEVDAWTGYYRGIYLEGNIIYPIWG